MTAGCLQGNRLLNPGQGLRHKGSGLRSFIGSRKSVSEVARSWFDGARHERVVLANRVMLANMEAAYSRLKCDCPVAAWAVNPAGSLTLDPKDRGGDVGAETGFRNGLEEETEAMGDRNIGQGAESTFMLPAGHQKTGAPSPSQDSTGDCPAGSQRSR